MKFPRIKHLHNSPNVRDDDDYITGEEYLDNVPIVVTEKLDGENTSFHQDYVHARSEDSIDAPWRHYVKSIHARVRHMMPSQYEIFGENMYASHSIYYEALTDYFYVFMIFDHEKDYFLSVADTQEFCMNAGLKMVPVIFRGNLCDFDFKHRVSAFSTNSVEGYVIRPVNSIPANMFDKMVAKWVRENHVQTDVHWTKHWSRNSIRVY